eukprot:c1306_g1_i1.p1 GENE.c1306_g1_i1~~c1306_g1_i1.p1  ORF type:complete len:426 (+),score=86.72 c1306_g1_i1:44-1321(+)
MSKLLAFAIAVCCVAAAPLAEIDDGSLEMAAPVHVDNTPVQVVSGLVGDIAEDIEPTEIRKGPKVNGGFAINVNPLNAGEKRVANADCAGHIVDGKCVRLFPKRSRTATLDDNMLSPEQSNSNLYEADIHQMVKTHFNQNVMEETKVDSHHVGLPGYEVIQSEMNKEDNHHANSISDTLFPIGSGMMHSGDSEVNVDLSSLMSQGVVVPPAEEPKEPAAGATATPKPAPVIHNPASNKDDEVSDLEEIIPQDNFDAEPGLPPTPTPTPTPDPELIRQAQIEAENHARQVAVCAALMEKEGYICASNNQDLESVAPVEHVQIETPKVVEPAAPVQPVYDAADVKGNLQRLISYCVNKVTQDFTTSPLETETDSHLLVQKRTRFSQSLVKFASAMGCVDSEDFPACMPSEASRIIQQAPVDGQWNCF